MPGKGRVAQFGASGFRGAARDRHERDGVAGLGVPFGEAWGEFAAGDAGWIREDQEDALPAREEVLEACVFAGEASEVEGRRRGADWEAGSGGLRLRNRDAARPQRAFQRLDAEE